MSYSREELEHRSEAIENRRKEREYEREYLTRLNACTDKYYNGSHSKYAKCSHGFLAFFRNENDMKKCQEKVYDAYLKCVNGKKW